VRAVGTGRDGGEPGNVGEQRQGKGSGGRRWGGEGEEGGKRGEIAEEKFTWGEVESSGGFSAPAAPAQPGSRGDGLAPLLPSAWVLGDFVFFLNYYSSCFVVYLWWGFIVCLLNETVRGMNISKASSFLVKKRKRRGCAPRLISFYL